jgi:hypothetical protein
VAGWGCLRSCLNGHGRRSQSCNCVSSPLKAAM